MLSISISTYEPLSLTVFVQERTGGFVGKRRVHEEAGNASTSGKVTRIREQHNEHVSVRNERCTVAVVNGCGMRALWKPSG